jgi:hypothetical protein
MALGRMYWSKDGKFGRTEKVFQIEWLSCLQQNRFQANGRNQWKEWEVLLLERKVIWTRKKIDEPDERQIRVSRFSSVKKGRQARRNYWLKQLAVVLSFESIRSKERVPKKESKMASWSERCDGLNARQFRPKRKEGIQKKTSQSWCVETERMPVKFKWKVDWNLSGKKATANRYRREQPGEAFNLIERKK